MTDRAQVHGTPHRPPPGPPVEVILWRITPKAVGRGERRDLIDNVKMQSWEHLWRYRYPGPGRYRAEFRDDRRQIVKVEYFNAMPPEQGGQILQTKGRHRPSKRSIPPPVDAWDDRTPNQEMCCPSVNQTADWVRCGEYLSEGVAGSPRREPSRYATSTSPRAAARRSARSARAASSLRSRSAQIAA